MRILDEVAADITATGLPDELDVDASLARCVQLSLSTSPAPSVVSAEASLVAFAHGMTLHAATTVDGRDRKRLQRMCKYLLRPPFADGAVHLLPDGCVRLELPRKGRLVDVTPEQFPAKLAALVPPPRQNLVRYAGCFAKPPSPAATHLSRARPHGALSRAAAALGLRGQAAVPHATAAARRTPHVPTLVGLLAREGVCGRRHHLSLRWSVEDRRGPTTRKARAG